MPLSFTQITGTFEDAQGNPLSGTAEFTPNTTVYAAGVPVLQADAPVQAQITAGALKNSAGGTLQLLDQASTGLTFVGQTGFFCYTVAVTVGGVELDPWSFFLAHSSAPVDLYSLANTPAGGFTNPMTTLGDLIDGGANGTPLRLAGNTSATREFLVGQGTGSAAQAPAWSAIQAGDVPTLNQNTTGTAANITDTLDQVPAPAANVSMNSHKITGLANGSAATDAAAFGQLPSSGTPLPTTQGGTGLDESTLAALLTALLAAGGGTMGAALDPAVVALSQSAGNIAVNAALGNVFGITLTASGWTFSNPTNGVDGQVIRIKPTQDASGSRTANWGTAYDWGSTGGTPNSAPTLTTTASKGDELGFAYNAASGKWRWLSAPFPQGYA